jgi:hypothetical protein
LGWYGDHHFPRGIESMYYISQSKPQKAFSFHSLVSLFFGHAIAIVFDATWRIFNFSVVNQVSLNVYADQ